MIELSDFRRDQNGIIIGQWRLFHCSKTFSADLGGACFYNGVTTGPVSGAVLQRIVAAIGDRIDRAEPWSVEIEKRSTSGVKPDARVHPRPEAAETVKPPEPDDDYADADRTQLFALCIAKGLSPDKRWGAERLRKYLRENE